MEEILNQYFPNVLTKIIAEDVYQYHETLRFDQVIAQIEEYSFGIRHLPVFLNSRMVYYGVPYLMYATSNAFYKLLRNPEYETLLSDSNDIEEDDKLFNADTWPSIMGDLLGSIAVIGESFIDCDYTYDFDMNML